MEPGRWTKALNRVCIALAWMLIAADILLASVYLVTYQITAARLLEVMIVIAVVLLGGVRERIRPSTWKVMIWAYALIAYKLLLDLTLHSDGSLESVGTFLIDIFIVSMLPMFEMIGERRINVPKTILIVIVPMCLLGAMQYYNHHYELWRMVPTNGLIIFERRTFDYLNATNRIVGTYRIAIGFSLVLGVAGIILWAKGMVQKQLFRRIAAMTCIAGIFILIVYSQTRSAIYGLPLAIFATYVLAGRLSSKQIALVSAFAIMGVLGFSSFQMAVTKYSKRSVFGMDANTYYKITSNLYGVYAALHENPLFGVQVNRDLDKTGENTRDIQLVRKGRQELGDILNLGNEYRLTATNHNLIAYYLKYYGFIGFVMLIGLMVSMYSKARRKTNTNERYAVMGTFVYFLQFSLLHNTQILEFLPLWLMLSHGDENA